MPRHRLHRPATADRRPGRQRLGPGTAADPDSTTPARCCHSDPAYSRLYYRDENGDLITGLIPEDGSPYIRVSPYAGAYPNDGCPGPPGPRPSHRRWPLRLRVHHHHHEQESPPTSAARRARRSDHRHGYQLHPPGGHPAPRPARLLRHRLHRDYSGSNYFRIAAAPPPPGLFLTTDPDTDELRIGLQFTTTAQTSLSSLPLQQVAGQPEHTVTANPLGINNGEVHLNTASGFQPADTIDTWLVIHGTQYQLRDIKVGGGN